MRKNWSLFGSTPSYEDSELVLLATPWAVTSSFGGGAEQGPERIASASSQMDFFSKERGDIRDKGIYFLSPPPFLKKKSQKIRKKALPVIALEEAAPGSFPKKYIEEINEACAEAHQWVYEETKQIHSAKKKFGLVGGEHSVSEGAIKYFGEVYKGDFGILHIDAHADLRPAYQGFHSSHASIMYNVLHQAFPPAKIVQIGVRDYSEEEYLLIKNNHTLHTFFDSEVKKKLFEGETWGSIAESMIQALPQKVYISLDVDGLEPSLFPHTGTPVPGGLSFEQVDYLLQVLVQSRRQIIGFDLVETADPFQQNKVKPNKVKQNKVKPNKATPTDEETRILWDAQSGARLLYKLCATSLFRATN